MPLSSDSQTSPAHSAALQQYDDEILDVESAPDICMANVVTNDNHAITLGIHLHDRLGFAALDTYSILLDADSNATTGAPADVGVAAGAEYVIDVADGASRLSSSMDRHSSPLCHSRKLLPPGATATAQCSR